MFTHQRRRGFELQIGILVLAALSGLTSGGCVGESDNRTSSQLWCEGMCTAVERCGYQGLRCLSDCVAQRPGLANMSTSGAAAEAPCLEQLTCPALTDDATWKTETRACWDKAQLSVTASPRVRDFCEIHALVWFDCGYRLSLDECRGRYGMWTDAVIERLSACDVLPSCDNFMSCEAWIFQSL
jgi:hypothetical protein